MKYKAYGIAVLVIWLTFVMGHPGEYDIQDPGHYLNSFLVRISSREVAEQVARDHGFELLEQLKHLDYYHFSHEEVSTRSKRSADDFVNRLKEDTRVTYVEQQITLKRVKRTHQVVYDKQSEFPIRAMEDNSKYYRIKPEFVSRGSDDISFTDEYFKDEWYLINSGQSGGTAGVDMNVARCWEQGYTGWGVVCSILDDGIDHTHEDLKRNYEPRASADFNDDTDVMNDPTPDKDVPGNDHGTRCAGEIAAEANNGICGVGVSYNARIGGIRMLDGHVTDRLEAKALMHEFNLIDIYSASWGPRDDGQTMEGLKAVSIAALKTSCEKGRNGKGNVYVWASGNGGNNGDHCGADGYVSSIYSISIQSMSDKGMLPYFGEKCCSTMAAVTAGGEPTKEEELKWRDKLKVVTTDINNGCIENFEGTSSAAPLATGCLALLLQANPDLTWRDVQHIVAKYARVPGPDLMWIINGAGYHVNIQFGFGLMDCAAMIEGAQKWTNVPHQHICQTNTQTVKDSEISASGCHKISFNFDGCQKESDKRITHLEHVEVTIKLTSPRRGDVEIFLTSPSGTRSELLGRRPNDASDEGIDFKFMTVHNWMENPNGEWTLEVCYNEGTDTGSRKNGKSHRVVKLKSWEMIAYGYDNGGENIMKKTFKPTREYLENLTRKELVRSRNVVLKRAKEMDTKEMDTKEESRDNADNTLGNLQKLLDGFGKAFGATEQNKRTFMENKSNKKSPYHHVKRIENESVSSVDKDSEDMIEEILSKMDGRDTSTDYLREILMETRDELKQARLNRLRSNLISKLKQMLDEEQF